MHDVSVAARSGSDEMKSLKQTSERVLLLCVTQNGIHEQARFCGTVFTDTVIEHTHSLHVIGFIKRDVNTLPIKTVTSHNLYK